MGPATITRAAALAPWLGAAASVESNHPCEPVSVAPMVNTPIRAPGLPPHAAYHAPHRKALTEVQSLHNTVVHHKAKEALLDQRRKDAGVFLSVPLWWYSQVCLSGLYSHPLEVRRFVAD